MISSFWFIDSLRCCSLSLPSILFLIVGLGFGFEFTKLSSKLLSFSFIVSCLGLSIRDTFLQILQFLRESLFNILQGSTHFFKLFIEFLLAISFLLVLGVQLLKLWLVILLQFFELLVLFFNLLFFDLNQVLLIFYFLLHLMSFFVLSIFIVFHGLLQILLNLLDVVNFLFLLLEQISSLL